jgi:hypothetical protein
VFGSDDKIIRSRFHPWSMTTTNERFHARLTFLSREMTCLMKGFRHASPVSRYFSAKSAAFKECAGKSVEEIAAAFEKLRMKMECIESFTRPEQDSMAGSFDAISEVVATAELMSRPVMAGEEPVFAISLELPPQIFAAEVTTRLHQSQRLLGAFAEPHPIHWYFNGKVSGFLQDRDVPAVKLRTNCKTFRWSSCVRVAGERRVSTSYHMLGAAAVTVELMALNYREERRQEHDVRTVG